MRECVQRGVDTVPSPHWLFNCAGGRCKGGSVVGDVVEVLSGNGGVVVDVDEVVGNETEFEQNCTTGFAKETILSSWDPRRVAAFNIDYTNERLLKTELLVYRNPVLAVILPDREMSLYPRSKCDWDCVNEVEGANATDSIQLIWVQFSDGDWTAVTTIEDPALPPPPLPVYHATGPPLMPHAVVVLGWGSVPEPHWVVQNSWGSEWGQNGRGKVAVGDVVRALVLDARGWKDRWLVGGVVWLVTVVAVGVDVVVWWRGGGGVKEKVDDDGEGVKIV